MAKVGEIVGETCDNIQGSNEGTMTEKNNTSQLRACDAFARILERIQRDMYISTVDIALVCSFGGISNITVSWVEMGVDTRDKSNKINDDQPHRATQHFVGIIRYVQQARYSGTITLRLHCHFGKIHNTSVIRQESNLFARGDDIGWSECAAI